MLLSAIIVNWNSRDCLRDCLESLQADLQSIAAPSEIWVMDNASSDGSREMVVQGFPAARFVSLGRNLGFARAANEGGRRSLGRYLLILNPDTLILPGGVARLLEFVERNPEVGAAGPRLLNPDGSLQPSWGRFPDLLTEAVCQFYLYRWLPAGRPVGNRLARLARPPEEPLPVDWVAGACLMVRRQAWEEAGPLDEEIFLYGEDLDWCFRARQSGWPIWHIPQARVVHLLSHATGREPACKLLRQAQGMQRFFRAYRSSPAATAHIALMAFGAVLRWTVWRIKAAAAGGKGGQARQMAKGYAAVLKNCLTSGSQP
ncbi:MAG: glycosyltransferase family 2 protein [Armatimonadetes bacterium]|nr:glycosyltransferase family 2 protein [Armatimonadota bacterium]